MADNDAKYLDAFGIWLRTLGEDAEQLCAVLASPEAAVGARKAAAGGLNYLFKSLDLIPDGIDDIGYLDDAFVLRVAAAHARQAGALDGYVGALRLADGDSIVREFLGEAYGRLDKYVAGLRTGAARGRTVHEIVSGEAMLAEFVADVKRFAVGYRPPQWTRNPKNLIKLRAFFDAKLPQ